MMNKDQYERLDKIVSDISKTNDQILIAARDINIVLSNLSIESAHITQVNGIEAIAQELDRIRLHMSGMVNKLIDADRSALKVLMTELKEEALKDG